MLSIVNALRCGVEDIARRRWWESDWEIQQGTEAEVVISIGAEKTIMNTVLFLFRVTRYRAGFQLSDLYR